jgi:hypothetical protein
MVVTPFFLVKKGGKQREIFYEKASLPDPYKNNSPSSYKKRKKERPLLKVKCNTAERERQVQS